MIETQVLQNNYQPTEKAQVFHGSDAFVIVLVGGMGSGKSRMAIQEIEQSSCQWAGLHAAVYRKTLPSLRDSTLQEWRSLCTPEVWQMRERDVQAVAANNSFVNFRGLDDPSKAKSTEYGLIVMEEADEFTKEDFLFLKARVRQKGPWPLRIVLILNPVDEDHWIPQEFTGKNAAQYEQQGGLLVHHLSTYDNVQNLPPGYIEQNCTGMTPDEIDRYIHGKWGSVIKGEVIYGKILNPDLHIEKWEYTNGIHRLVRGWDFGFNRPACSFRLIDPMGRKNARWMEIGDKIELDLFAKHIQEVTQRMFEGAPIRDFCDPRGHDKSMGSDSRNASTAVEVLRDIGIYATGERGAKEYVESGIKQVRKEFSTLIGGRPELTIDPRNTLLRSCYFSKYVRGEDGAPRKDRYWDNIADADRYISHHYKYDDAVQSAISRNKLNRANNSRPKNPVTGY